LCCSLSYNFRLGHVLGNFSPALKEALLDLREEFRLSGEDTINWKDFLAATMDKNLAMKEDKIREAFDHFKVRRSLMKL
jgi:Ca2+-binding EF-hand superfamily protein